MFLICGLFGKCCPKCQIYFCYTCWVELMYIQKTQGISARETCPDGILVVLVNGEMGFEKLAEKLERHYARATVSKYLTELFDDGSFVRRRSRRGNYYLTEKGRKKAKTKQFVKQISEISDEFTEQFILNYKDYVMNRVKNSL